MSQIDFNISRFFWNRFILSTKRNPKGYLAHHSSHNSVLWNEMWFVTWFQIQSRISVAFYINVTDFTSDEIVRNKKKTRTFTLNQYLLPH